MAISAQWRARVGEKGASQVIVAAMVQHARSAAVQLRACMALMDLALGSPANRVEIAKAGGCRALVEALRAHRGMDMQAHTRSSTDLVGPSAALIAEFSCGALRNLCSNNTANKHPPGRRILRVSNCRVSF